MRDGTGSAASPARVTVTVVRIQITRQDSHQYIACSISALVKFCIILALNISTTVVVGRAQCSLRQSKASLFCLLVFGTLVKYIDDYNHIVLELHHVGIYRS